MAQHSDAAVDEVVDSVVHRDPVLAAVRLKSEVAVSRLPKIELVSEVVGAALAVVAVVLLEEELARDDAHSWLAAS